MGGPPGSQVSPLPTNLPFRLVSKTIGSGAYASIRKAVPPNQSGPVIAVKFINKDHAFRAGRLRPKQLMLELSLHHSVCPHDNIIRYLSHGEDPAWVWMCLELAEGGDLFDKIEADEGVGEDVAHFYFAQLSSAIAWCHAKGVAHRDVKPENMLLSGGGDLKLADFGLATKFLDTKTGARKSCAMVCGSPPYIAPEILAVGHANRQHRNDGGGESRAGYDPQGADVWSCAIVLFVLLVGNTPWDSPVAEDSYEFHQYVTTGGRPSDELWDRVPPAVLSLLRGMLRVDPADRFSLMDVRKHPWFTRSNPHLNDKGKAANPLSLATQMLESLHIDLSQAAPSSSEAPSPSGDAMDVDGGNALASSHPNLAWGASTQPETPVAEVAAFDWEAPPRVGGGGGLSSSQPLLSGAGAGTNPLLLQQSQPHLLDSLAEDPSMSQFTATPSVPLTLTQQARQFKDIVPAHSLARFLSALPAPQLLPLLQAALHRLNVPVAPLPADCPLLQPRGTSLSSSHSDAAAAHAAVSLRIKTVDRRQQPLSGAVVVERIALASQDGPGADVLEVRFVKAKGDPIGWRRLFKQVAVLCREGVVVPQG